MITEAEHIYCEIKVTKTDTLTMSKEAGRHTFIRDGVRYRVAGVRDGFSSSLRVSVRAEIVSEESGSRGYVDTVDLFSARSRTAFALALSSALSGIQETSPGIQAARVEKDLLAMLDLLEAERDAKFNPSENAPHVITPEERAAGMELLLAPDIMERIIDDLTALGYVGEDLNKLLLYLAATSRKMPDPISVIVSSQSASGKSYLIEMVKALMPEEDVVAMTSLSDQALIYLGDQALLHKFLVMGEAVHADSVEHQIREMLSARSLSRLVTLKDEKTGELSSRLVRKKVLVALAMSTTSNDVNPENSSRCFVISTDESAAQTKAVHIAQRGKYSLTRLAEREQKVPEVIKRHIAAQRLLENRMIVNPYAHLLDFPARLMRTRRDHERFLDLISSVCFLRQFQKVKKEDERGHAYVECDLEDYRIAYKIMSSILPSTLSNIPRSARELYEELRVLAREKAEAQGLTVEEVVFTQRELRDATGISYMIVKRALRSLCDYEYIIEMKGVQRGSRGVYKLSRDEELSLVDISAIPSPEMLISKAQKAGFSL